jgi:hypothetical protein
MGGLGKRLRSVLGAFMRLLSLGHHAFVISDGGSNSMWLWADAEAQSYSTSRFFV